MRYAQDYLTPRQRVMSGAFALGMHALLLLLLIFGVTWQKKMEPQANIVDLYPNLPSRPKPAEPPPRPEAKPAPQPTVEPRPPVQPKAEAKPVPKPDIAKPDIALKEKAEKARRELEEKQKEARKREDEAKAVAARQQQAKEAADAQRRIKEQEDAQRKVMEQAAAARQSQMDKYKNAIRDRIKRFIVLPPNIQGNPEAEFDVIQLPGGEVLGVKLKRSSGNAAYDSAVERAILKAQPLPRPPDPTLFERELNLTFKPQE